MSNNITPLIKNTTLLFLPNINLKLSMFYMIEHILSCHIKTYHQLNVLYVKNIIHLNKLQYTVAIPVNYIRILKLLYTLNFNTFLIKTSDRKVSTYTVKFLHIKKLTYGKVSTAMNNTI